MKFNHVFNFERNFYPISKYHKFQSAKIYSAQNIENYVFLIEISKNYSLISHYELAKLLRD